MLEQLELQRERAVDAEGTRLEVEHAVPRTRPAIRAAAASIWGRPTGSVVRSCEPVMVQRLVEHRFVDAELAGHLGEAADPSRRPP